MPSIPAIFTRWMRSRWSLLVIGALALALALALASPTGAQVVSERGNQPEMIPRDLVVALLSFGQPGNVDIRVAQVPEDVPPELVPPGSQLLGSMSQFENVVVVLGVSEPPDSAVSAMASRLLSSGWARPPASSRLPMRGGFVAADFANSGPDGVPGFLCRGEAMVNLMGMYRMSGGSLLRVTYNRNARSSGCREQPNERAFRSPYDDAPVPTLRAPAGAMMTDGTGMSSSSSGGMTMHARLSARLEPAELVAHYDSQMKAAGWTPLADGAVEFLAARRYQKVDDRKRTWFGTLYAIMTPQGNEHDVSLHLTRR